MSVRPHPKQKTDPTYASTWIIDYRDANGKRRQVERVGDFESVFAIEQSLRIRSKRPSPTVYPSINEVVPLFREAYQLEHRPRSLDRVAWSLKHILPFFGRYQFQSITPQLIDQYKRQRLEDGVKPITINKELGALSAMCRWANEVGYCEEIRIKRFPPKMTKSPVILFASHLSLKNKPLLTIRTKHVAKREIASCHTLMAGMLNPVDIESGHSATYPTFHIQTQAARTATTKTSVTASIIFQIIS